MAEPVGGADTLASRDDETADEIPVCIDTLDLFMNIPQVLVGHDSIARRAIEMDGNAHRETRISNESFVPHFSVGTEVLTVADNCSLDV